jgi:methyl-accepting chemotaxis protein
MKKIAFKLVLVFSSATAFLLIISVLFIYFQQKKNILELSNDFSNQVAYANSEIIAQLIQKEISEMRVFSREIKTTDFKPVLEKLKAYSENVKMRDTYSISDLNGNYENIHGVKGNIADREYFQTLLYEKFEFIISNPIISKATKKPSFVIAFVINDKESNPIGVLFKTVILEDLSDIVSNIKIGKEGYGWICDGNGLIMVHPDKTKIMTLNLLESSKSGYKGMEKIGKKMINGEYGVGEASVGEKEVYIVYHHIRGTPNWTLGITVPKDQVYKPVSNVLMILFYANVSILVIMIIIVLIFSRRVVAPLKDTVLILKDISEGEGDLTKRLKITTKDEIGILADHFNNFISKLAAIINQLKKIGVKSKDIGNTLAASSEEISATVVEISTTMDSVKDKIHLLNSEVKNSNTSVDEVKMFIEKVVGLIESQSASVTESSAAIEEMIASLKNITGIIETKKQLSDGLAEIAKYGEQDMKMTSESISSISKSANVIMDLIKSINDISEKTNLLAMNAAIEAAHAGESGKGFAVVAGEIRKLAEATNLNAKNISATLKNIIEMINETNRISIKTGESINKIFIGIGDVADSMSEMMHGMTEISLGSSQITESLGELISITDKVRTSSKEVDSNFEMIENSMKKVTQLSDENLTGIEETSISVNEISTSMQLLTRLGSENSDNIKLLDDEISKFKV